MNNTLNMREFVEVPVGGAVIKLSDFFPSENNSRWRHATIGVTGGAVRWLAITDQNPSVSNGMYVNPGGQINWDNPEIDYSGLIYNAKFIKAGANDATLEVALYW